MKWKFPCGSHGDEQFVLNAEDADDRLDKRCASSTVNRELDVWRRDTTQQIV